MAPAVAIGGKRGETGASGGGASVSEGAGWQVLEGHEVMGDRRGREKGHRTWWWWWW